MDDIKVIKGLANLGCTCYMNCVLQILAHTPAIVEALKCTSSPFVAAWNRLVSEMIDPSGSTTVRPTEFLNAVCANAGTTVFRSPRCSHDASEFLVFMLDRFHAELSQSVGFEERGSAASPVREIFLEIRRQLEHDYSPIRAIFTGIAIHDLQSADDSHSYTPELFQDLTLAITAPTLTECLRNYAANEQMGDKVRTTAFWSMPPILVIHVHRNVAAVKPDRRPLIIPPTLKMSCLCDAADYAYDLYGAILHVGSNTCGHYTAAVKTTADNWALFDDACTTTSSEPPLGDGSSVYCVFYKRLT